MTAQQNILGFVEPRRHIVRSPVVGMELLHQPSVRLRDLFGSGAWQEAQNLISLLLGHRPRIAASAPRVGLVLTCLAPSGEPAVEISL